MGVAPQHTLGIGDPDRIQHLQRRLADLGAPAAPVRPDDVAELALDAQHGVECTERVLRDEPDARPSDLAELPGWQPDEVGPLEADRPAGDASR